MSNWSYLHCRWGENSMNHTLTLKWHHHLLLYARSLETCQFFNKCTKVHKYIGGDLEEWTSTLNVCVINCTVQKKKSLNDSSWWLPAREWKSCHIINDMVVTKSVLTDVLALLPQRIWGCMDVWAMTASLEFKLAFAWEKNTMGGWFKWRHNVQKNTRRLITAT